MGALYNDLNDVLTPYANKINKLGFHKTALKYSAIEHGSTNLIECDEDKTSGGLSFKWNPDGSCLVNGSRSSSVALYLVGDSEGSYMPNGFVPGNTYNLMYSKVGGGTPNVHVRIVFYDESHTIISSYNAYSDYEFTIPQNATGISLALRVSGGTVVNNETVKAVILNAKTNKELELELEETCSDVEIFKQTALKFSVSENVVPSNSNFDDYTTVGQYVVQTAAIARGITNIPEKAIGQLLVSKLTSNNTIIQIYIAKTPNMYIRYYAPSTGFSSWYSFDATNINQPIPYSWMIDNFSIHNPEEEKRYMIESVKDILDITITDTTDWVSETISGRLISASKIYDMWDELHARYPEYVDQGEIIGYSKDQNGSNYAPIKAYYIHPRNIYTSYGNVDVDVDYNNLPTIYMVAGTHGSESSPTWTLLSMFLKAFSTNSIYSNMLTGICYRIIPVLDIWSYDNKKRGLAAAYELNGDPKSDAIDGNGDILPIYDGNRQCVCLDDTNPSFASLNIPSYATEALALTTYINSHHFGEVVGDCFIDLHNCSYSLGYLTTTKPNIANMYNVMIDSLNKDWKKLTTFSNGDPVDYYSSNTGDHTQQRGKILAREPAINSYSWFFAKAYNSFSSNTLEVQQSDDRVCSNFAISKANDITARWINELLNAIRTVRIVDDFNNLS